MAKEVVLQSLKNELVLKLVGSIIIHQDPRPIDGLLANLTDSDMWNLRWIILRRFVGGLCVPSSCTAEVQLSLFHFFLGEGVLQGPILFTWYVQLSVSKRDIVFYIKFPRKSPCIVITMIRAFVLWKRLIAFVTCNARYFVLGCSGKLTDKLINLWTPKFIITRIKELMVSCPNEDHCVFGLIGDSPYWHSD